MNKIKNPKLPIATFHWLIFIQGLVYVILGPKIATLGPYIGILLNELLLIMIPALIIYLIYLKDNAPPYYSINSKTIGLVSICIICTFPIILLLNGLFLSQLSNWLYLKNYNLELIRQSDSLLQQIVMLAFFPAIFEEFYFRGVIEEYYIRSIGPIGILFSSLIFALFHFDLQNLLSPFLFGIILGYIYYLTRSKSLVIYAHFLHNVISILFIHFYNEGLIEKLKSYRLVAKLGSVQMLFMLILLFLGIISIYGIFITLNSIKKEGEFVEKNKLPTSLNQWISILLLVGLYIVFSIGGNS